MSAIPWPSAIFQLVCFIGGTLASFQLVNSRTGRPLTRVRLVIGLVGVVLAMVASMTFFDEPMHDMALVFGYHGRWGCHVVGKDGLPANFLTGQTVFFLLYVPVIVTIGWRGIGILRRSGS